MGSCLLVAMVFSSTADRQNGRALAFRRTRLLGTKQKVPNTAELGIGETQLEAESS